MIYYLTKVENYSLEKTYFNFIHNSIFIYHDNLNSGNLISKSEATLYL